MKNDVLMAFIVFQAVFFLIDIYVLTKTNRDIARKSEYSWFCALLIIHMFYLVLNSLWSLQEYNVLHFSHTGMMLVCAGSYLAISACSFVFFRFTIERIRFAAFQKKAVKLLFLLPEVVTVLLIISSLWTGWIFRIDEANTLIEGPAYLVMLVVSSLYLLAIVVVAIFNICTTKSALIRRSNIILLVAVLVIISFVFLDNMIPKVSILPVAVFAAIIVIFINMQMSNINTDALTGLFNRRMADEYLQKQLTEISEDTPLYLYMCDINDFKTINDTYGHVEGDRALQLCGEALRSATFPRNGFAARFGGDEFLMCWQPETEPSADPELLINEIETLLKKTVLQQGKPYQISICIGFAVCKDPSTPLAVFIRQADEMLYHKKKEYHASRQTA